MPTIEAKFEQWKSPTCYPFTTPLFHWSSFASMVGISIPRWLAPACHIYVSNKQQTLLMG